MYLANKLVLAVDKLSNSEAEDFYGLSNYVMKNIKTEILLPLTKIVNRILYGDIFQECLKISIVSHIIRKVIKHPLTITTPFHSYQK